MSVKGICVERYGDERREEWDRFVECSANGTLFHRRRFLGYHPADRFRDLSLMIYRGGRLTAVWPAAFVEDGGVPVLKSHPGASYGGLVVDEPPGIGLAEEMVDGVLTTAVLEGFRRVEFRMAPKIQCRLPCDELDYAWLRRGARIRDWELGTCYPLVRLAVAGWSDEAVLGTFTDACRRATRKALKNGLEVRLCTVAGEFSAYWEMLRRNLTRHEASPTHSREELFDLKSRFPDDIHLLGVFRGQRMAAGIVAFICNQVCVHVFYFASDGDMQNYRPLNLGVLRLIQMAAGRRLNYVDFGISTEEGGSRINSGLFRFKEGFGGAGIMRTYWTWEPGVDR